MPGIIIAAALIILLTIGIFLFRNRSGGRDAALAASTVDRLRQLEDKDVAPIENRIREESGSAGMISGGSQDSEGGEEGSSSMSEDEIKSSILAGNLLDNVEIRQAFQNTAIIGDSITESIWEYGYLDQDVVISHRGLSVYAADEQIETAISMNPYAVFMAFGSNDLESYESNVDGYIDAYRIQIQKLHDALPGVPVYINGILPIQESAIAEIPALGYYPQYNEALQALCAETGCIFLDNSFIVQNDSSLYEPDGEHVIAAFYPQWLTHMAKAAGLG